MNTKRLSLLFATAVVFNAPNAFAQKLEDDVTVTLPDAEINALTDEDRQGFDGELTLGANLNMVSNSAVVGQVEGFSTLFGLNVIAGLDYLYKRHEVRNTFTMTESWSRTPVIDEFLKSSDTAQIESVYNYFLLDWMGLFGRGSVRTSLFVTEAVTADAENYIIERPDGTFDPVTTDRLKLSNGFEPLDFSESAGVFADPISNPKIRWTNRLGIGGRQTLAAGVLTTLDDADTDVVEVVELLDVHQLGVEAFTGIKGKFYDKRVTYDLGASALIPVINNDSQDRGAIELMRYGFMANVSTTVFDWMSLNYQFRVLKDQQLLDKLQMQHALLLTFNYSFIKRDGGKSGPDAAEQLATAEQALIDAKEKCADLEADAAKLKEAAEAAKVAEDEAAAKKAADKAAAEAAANPEPKEEEPKEEEPKPETEEEPKPETKEDAKPETKEDAKSADPKTDGTEPAPAVTP